MRLWRLAIPLVVSTAACVLTSVTLNVLIPSPTSTPRPAPVLESVSPAQLAAIGLKLEQTVQPLVLPAKLTSLGVRLPTTILMPSDAEAVVEQSSGGVRGISESVLAYATVTGRAAGLSGPTIVHRLVWAIVGMRTTSGSSGTLMEMFWLVDARSPNELLEQPVPMVVSRPAA